MSTKAVPKRGKVSDEEKIHHLLYNLNIFQQSLRFLGVPGFCNSLSHFENRKTSPLGVCISYYNRIKFFFINYLNGRTHIYIFLGLPFI